MDGRKVSKINFGENYIQDVNDDELRTVVQEGRLSATTTYDLVTEMDAIYICVPTPFNVNKDPDISYIVDSAEGIATGLRKGQVIILKSTTFPGTTEEHVQPILEKTGLKVGTDLIWRFLPNGSIRDVKILQPRILLSFVGALLRNVQKQRVWL